MENASKALIIAGGVMLAMLITSLVIYLNTSVTNFANAQDKKKETEQIAEFNRGYEAYNKSLMYGIDVITVINKAIEHNRAMDVSANDTPYYINIIIKTKDTFKTTARVVDTSKRDDDYENYEKQVDDISTIDTYIKDKIGSTYTLVANQDGYRLGEWDNNKEHLSPNSDIIGFFTGDMKDLTLKGNPNNSQEKSKVYYIYSALTNFKRGIFRCTNVEYSNKTGRINLMEFEQVKD